MKVPPVAASSLLLAVVLTSKNAVAQSEKSLPPVDVKAKAIESIVPSVEAEKKTLEETPGGVNLIVTPTTAASQYTLRDLFDYQPGVTLLDFFGGADHPILTIRGSGIQSHPLSRGVTLLENGLPINEADGSFILGMLEPSNARMAGVRRGANATNVATNSLGGEINFISQTGATETGNFRVQYGSFDTSFVRAAFGQSFENTDFHISATFSGSDGYRNHSDQRRYSFRGNFGVFATDDFENRTWISYTDQRFDIPGPLTLDKALNDPTNNINDVMPMVSTTEPYHDIQQFRIANRSLLTTGSIKHSLGLYYQDTDDLFMTPTTSRDNDNHTFGAVYDLDGKAGPVDYGFAVSWAHSSMDITYKGNPRNPNAPIQNMPETNYDGKAENIDVQLKAAWQLSEELRLDGKVKWVHARRDLHDNRLDESQNRRWDWVSPKVGLVWTPQTDLSFFVNVSTTREAPTFAQMIRMKAPPPPPATMVMVPLEPQRSITYEFGGRGKVGELVWDLAVYRSDLKKELIEYSIDGITSYTLNYDGKSRHQGVELGLSGDWKIDGFGSIFGRLSYTFNDFNFIDGTYEGNQIAGIPRNMIATEVMAKVGKWEIGPNLHWVIGSTYSDYSNTTKYGGYATLGLKVRYQLNDDLSFFLQGDNLTDRRYIASTTTPASTSATGAHYFPGNGISVSGGLNWRF